MQKNTEISDRISEMLELLDSNPNSFAKKLDYQRAQTIYDIVNGKSAPSYDFFRRFQLSEYSDIVNLDWLLTGRGEKLRNCNPPNINTNLYTNPNTNLSPKSKEKNDSVDARQTLNKVEQIEIRLPDLLGNDASLPIPFYDLPVSAGSLGVLDTETADTTVPAGYVQLPVFRGCEAIFPITGISMEPIVHSGDWIGIKPIENISRNWDFIQTGVIYFIVTREDRMIKFIEKTDDEDFIVCSSPNYNPFKVYKGDILNLYRVKAIARGL